MVKYICHGRKNSWGHTELSPLKYNKLSWHVSTKLELFNSLFSHNSPVVSFVNNTLYASDSKECPYINHFHWILSSSVHWLWMKYNRNKFGGELLTVSQTPGVCGLYYDVLYQYRSWVEAVIILLFGVELEHLVVSNNIWLRVICAFMIARMQIVKKILSYFRILCAHIFVHIYIYEYIYAWVLGLCK